MKLRSRAAKLPLLIVISSLCLVCGCTAPQSPADAARAVVFKGRLSRQHLPTEGKTLLYAQLQIGPGAIPEVARTSANLALVIDTSGSMEGEAITRAKEAAKQMLASLVDGDRLAVVSFNTDVEVLLPSTPIDAGARSEVAAMVEHMQAQGTTDMRMGLEAGLAEVERHLDPTGVNGIVLLGDGLPNDPTGIEELAQRAGQKQIRITALGLGLDYNEALMASIALYSGGRFHYIDKPDQVASFFKDEVLRLHRIYAKGLQLELVLGPDVDHVVLGRELDSEQRRLTIPLGDLSHREAIDVMIRLVAPGRSEGAAIEIRDAKLTYVVPAAGDAAAEQRVYLGAHATDDGAKLAAVDYELEQAGTIADAKHATLMAVAQARRGERTAAEKSIDFALERIAVQSKHGGEKELAGHAEELQTLRKNLPQPQPLPPAAASEAEIDFADDEAVQPAPAEEMSPVQQRQLKSSHDSAVQSFAPR